MAEPRRMDSKHTPDFEVEAAEGDIKFSVDTRPVLLQDNFDSLDLTIWDKTGAASVTSSLLTIEPNGSITTRDDALDTAKTYGFGVMIFNAKIQSDSSIGFFGADGSYIAIVDGAFVTYNAATGETATHTIPIDDTIYHTYSIFWTPDWCRIEIDNATHATITQGMVSTLMYVKLLAGATNPLVVDAVHLFPVGQISGQEAGAIRTTGKFISDSFTFRFLFEYPVPAGDAVVVATEPAPDENYIWYIIEYNTPPAGASTCKIGRTNQEGTVFDDTILASNTFLADTDGGNTKYPACMTFGVTNKFLLYDEANDKYWYWNDAAAGAIADAPDGSFNRPAGSSAPNSMAGFSNLVWLVTDCDIAACGTTPQGIHCLNIDTEAYAVDYFFLHHSGGAQTRPTGIAYLPRTKEIVLYESTDQRLYFYNAADATKVTYVRRTAPLPFSWGSTAHIGAAYNYQSPLYLKYYSPSYEYVYRLDEPTQVAVLTDPVQGVWSDLAAIVSNTGAAWGGGSTVDLLSAIMTSTITVDTELNIAQADVNIADVDSLLYGWDAGGAAWEKIHTDGSNRLLVYDAQLTSVIDLLSTVEIGTDLLSTLQTLFQSNVDLASTAAQLLSQFTLSTTDTLLQSNVDLASTAAQLVSQFDLSGTDAYLLSQVGQLSDIAIYLGHGAGTGPYLEDIRTFLEQFDLSSTDAQLLSVVGQLSDISILASQFTLTNVAALLQSNVDLTSTVAQLANQFRLSSTDLLLQSNVDLASFMVWYIQSGLGFADGAQPPLVSAVDLLSTGEQHLSNIHAEVSKEPTASHADMAFGAIAVNSTPTFIASIATSGVILIINDLQASTPDVVYLGSGAVATNTGVPLSDGRSITFENILGGIYGICDVGAQQQVRYMKFSNV